MGFSAAAIAVWATALVARQPTAPCGVDGTFCSPGACHRLRAHLTHRLHGQPVAHHLLVDAVCDHVEQSNPRKPLVASLHGSFGVGKSYFHQLLAQALYNASHDAYFDEQFDIDAESGGGAGGDVGGGWTSAMSF
eukprot:CAMPEP_0198706630 /NCGR_PEP_ID=MMETSP1468-20131203/391066_1 /TAXON_ID=1461545 /ORGANISM="Mantoniella sp, Strain CCMP1436" /LENGTH=134 /DNA_ID=CAMNT_0044465579 /DNA_START=679 /DNA_END=1080 /DNA_ORIENTATION=-